MKKWSIRYSITLFSLLIVDFIWLNFVAKHFYQRELGSLMIDESLFSSVRLLGAGLVYLLMALGIVHFVLRDQGQRWVCFQGFIFGIILYGVYEWTNFAILKDWTLSLVLLDWLWGGVLCALVSQWVYFIERRLKL